MHVAIIGNGIAGITAARSIRKRQPKWRITVVSGETDFHYSRPALMYVFMGHMRFRDTMPYPPDFFRKNRIDLLRAWVTRVDTVGRLLHLGGQGTLPYDELIIATGSQSNRFGWPGQDLRRVQGLYSVQDVESLHAAMPEVKRAVIVGGGLIGVELAEMLLSREVQVTFLVREASYWNNVLPPEESEMVSRLVRSHHIDLRLESELSEIHDDGSGAAGAVTTSAGDRIEAQLVGLTAGVRPNITLAMASGVPCGRGILVDGSLKTEVDHVWAAGDCAEIKTDGPRNTIQQVWYTGRFQGEAVAEAITGQTVKYDSGIWFNSAKFFDLEYQVYGEVPSALNPNPALRHRYWEHPGGQHSIRLVTDADDRLVGVNVMGIRFRHEICEGWIRDRTPINDVLTHLPKANFDPEFYKRFEPLAVTAMKAVK